MKRARSHTPSPRKALTPKQMGTRQRVREHTPGPYTIAQTADVLVIEVPLETSTYPSRNHEHGPMNFSAKSDEYRILFLTIQRAAEEAVSRGWIPIDTPCDFTLTRICRDARVRDALNLGGCEANALTKGGAWTDDTLGAPSHLDIQVDPRGPDRLVLILRRIYSTSSTPRAARPPAIRRRRGRATPPPTPQRPSPDSGDHGTVVIYENGDKPLTPAESRRILEAWSTKR